MANTDTIEGLITELQHHVRTNRVKLDEIFTDFDRLRKGVVTEAQFASAIGSIKLPRMALQQKHLQLLCDNYVVVDPLTKLRIVPYKVFVDDMDDASPLRELERNPSGEGINLEQAVPKFEPNELTPAEEAVLNKYTQEFIQSIVTKGLYFGLKEVFADFDKHSCGRVSASQFHRTFPFKVSDEAMRILIKRYQDPYTKDVNYLYWVREMEQAVATARPALACVSGTSKSQKSLSGFNTSYSPTYTRTGRILDGDITVESVEEEIVNVCFTRRIRIHEFFRDFDPRRCGLVTRAQFATALTVTGLTLAEDELQLLYRKYEAQDRTWEGSKVKWLDFADYIDSVFTMKGLELVPVDAKDRPTLTRRTELKRWKKH
jgi:Ca2+-binding EF-hand superfamily protein